MDVRVRVKYPDGRTDVLIVKSEDVFTTCGRRVIKVEKGFMIYPFGTEIKVYRA